MQGIGGTSKVSYGDVFKNNRILLLRNRDIYI